MTDWNNDPIIKEIAVDVRELPQVLIEPLLVLLERCVQHLEKLAEPRPGVAAVRIGPFGDQCREEVAGFEDA